MSLADELHKLEDLRRSGALTAEEFAQAKAALLTSASRADQQPNQHLSDHLAHLSYHNELARIDREWEIEQTNYMITGRHGHKLLPNKSTTVGSIVAAAFGVFWTVGSISTTGSAVFPLFGVVFTAFAVWMAIQCHAKSNAYEKALSAYHTRHRQVKPEQFRG